MPRWCPEPSRPLVRPVVNKATSPGRMPPWLGVSTFLLFGVITAKGCRVLPQAGCVVPQLVVYHHGLFVTNCSSCTRRVGWAPNRAIASCGCVTKVAVPGRMTRGPTPSRCLGLLRCNKGNL